MTPCTSPTSLCPRRALMGIVSMLLVWWSTLALLGTGMTQLEPLFGLCPGGSLGSPGLWEGWVQLGPWVGWACAVALALGACAGQTSPADNPRAQVGTSTPTSRQANHPTRPSTPQLPPNLCEEWVPPPPYEAAAIELLSLLQEHGRLVDFVMEDLSLYSDTQVARAAQRVHAGCRQALAQHMRIEAIDDGREGQRVYPKHYASETYLATHYQQCDVAGQTPVQPGLFHASMPLVLVHRGWKASLCSLKLRGTGPSQHEAWRIIVPARLQSVAASTPQANVACASHKQG